jgi:hypothetical protein
MRIIHKFTQKTLHLCKQLPWSTKGQRNKGVIEHFITHKQIAFY